MSKLPLYFMRLLCIGMFAGSVVLFVQALCTSNIALFVMYALPLGVLSGILFARYFVSQGVDHLIDSLFLSRQYLARVPVLLSAWQGDLIRGDYRKILQEMQQLPEAVFCDPEVTLLFARACMEMPGEELRGIEQMETFFRSGGKREIALLLYYADTAQPYRSPDDICTILNAECKKNGYSGYEKNLIQNRYSSMKG